MKAAMMFLPLLLVACSAHALPVESNAITSEDAVDIIVPEQPHVEEHIVTEENTELVRERRSPAGWQQGNGGGFPRPQPQPQQPRGSISGGVHREKGVGTIVHAQGQGNVWTSRNGNARLDAHGQWSKVVRGPARGKPNYNVGVTYTRRF